MGNAATIALASLLIGVTLGSLIRSYYSRELIEELKKNEQYLKSLQERDMQNIIRIQSLQEQLATWEAKEQVSTAPAKKK